LSPILPRKKCHAALTSPTLILIFCRRESLSPPLAAAVNAALVPPRYANTHLIRHHTFTLDCRLSRCTSRYAMEYASTYYHAIADGQRRTCFISRHTAEWRCFAASRSRLAFSASRSTPPTSFTMKNSHQDFVEGQRHGYQAAVANTPPHGLRAQRRLFFLFRCHVTSPSRYAACGHAVSPSSTATYFTPQA